MRRLAVFVLCSLLAAPAGTARAEQMQAMPTLPPLTTSQVAANCAVTGIFFSAAAALGIFRPMTSVIKTLAPTALLHEAVYGCGIGAASAIVVNALFKTLLPSMPPVPLDRPQADSQPILSATPGPAP